jgi:hypothetical protein
LEGPSLISSEEWACRFPDLCRRSQFGVEELRIRDRDGIYGALCYA